MICHLSEKYVSAVGYFVLHLWTTSEKSTKTSSCCCCGWLRWCVHFPHLHGKPRELRSEKLKREKRRTVKISKGVFCYQTRVFFLYLLLDYFWGNRTILDGVVWYVNYPTNGWSQKNDHIYIYIYWYVTLRWLCILGKGILAEYHQKIHFVLLVVRQVWRLSLNTQRYHQRLHCGVVWLLRSRAGEDGGALRYMLPMKATCVGGGP